MNMNMYKNASLVHCAGFLGQKSNTHTIVTGSLLLGKILFLQETLY